LIAARRLVVVLPELSSRAASHYAHYVPLLKELGRLLDTVVVVERGTAEPIDGMTVIAQRRTFFLTRAFELAAILIRLRLRGYRTAYGSYSTYFGIVGGVVGRLIGMRTGFWHCRSDFFNRTIEAPWSVRGLIRDTIPLILSLHLSRVVVTGTDNLARLYAATFRLPQDKLRVVPNDIDLNQWPCAGRNGANSPPTILFVHRLSEHKGARLLGPIFRAVLQEVPDARMVVVGGGPEESNVRHALHDEIASGQVEMHGYVSNPAVPPLMLEADVLLMPSFEEGFPRVLLEAMAAGLPFVAAEVGGVAMIVPDALRARLVKPGDVAGFSAELVRLIRDPADRATVARIGREHVQRYHVARVAPQLVEALSQA
jgi:glycosyltransferase involved in cell wall biosynthesis